MSNLLYIILFNLLLINNVITSRESSPTKIIGQHESSTARILNSLGFLAEDHRVEVQNRSYALSLVRARNPFVDSHIPPSREPLLFVHGIFVNANSFILNTAGVKPRNYLAYNISSMSELTLQKLLRDDPASQSLVFAALNFGYEVWLLNRRPTLESLRQNSKRQISNEIPRTIKAGKESEFEELTKFANTAVANYWNFSFDEEAMFDIPETIDYILSKTKREKLTYIGHSAGSALFLMTLAQRPEIEDKIHKATLWAPALYLRGNFRLIFREFLSLMLPLLTRINQPITPPFLVVPLEKLVEIVCTSELTQLIICDPLLDFVLGAGNAQSMVNNFNSNARFFDMISSREGAQLIQSNRKGKMHRFDFPDESQNMIAYGRPHPAVYDVSKIKLRTMTFWAGNTDIVVPVSDVDSIIQDMTVPVRRHLIEAPNILFGHNAFYIHKNISNLFIIPNLRTIAA